MNRQEKKTKNQTLMKARKKSLPRRLNHNLPPQHQWVNAVLDESANHRASVFNQTMQGVGNLDTAVQGSKITLKSVVLKKQQQKLDVL